jgi:hypothetical protein
VGKPDEAVDKLQIVEAGMQALVFPGLSQGNHAEEVQHWPFVKVPYTRSGAYHFL